MRYRIKNGETVELIKYVLTVTETDANGEAVETEWTAASDEERDKFLTVYPDAAVETVDNTGYEYLDGTKWTAEQLSGGELETAIEDGEIAMTQEEINAMLMLEIAELKAGVQDE